MNHIILGGLILFTYLALSTSVTLYNCIWGIVLTAIILRLIPSKRRPVKVSHLPRAFLAMLIYMVILIWNVLVGGFQVARLALDPRMPLKPGVVAVKPDCDHELGQALSAHAISLSPGELLIGTDESGMMYIHSLEIDQTEKVAQKEQKYRRYLLDLIFG